MMKKYFAVLFCLLAFATVSFAKDTLLFDFPNEGWHKVESPDGIKSKKCYVPVNQTSENYNEMLIFSERILKNDSLNAMALLQKQLGKDKNNYRDIYPQYIIMDENEAMVTWCSKNRNTCAVERAFKANEGIVMATYLNKAPHYSQNMFGRWSNILAMVKVYDKTGETGAKSLIELD